MWLRMGEQPAAASGNAPPVSGNAPAAPPTAPTPASASATAPPTAHAHPASAALRKWVVPRTQLASWLWLRQVEDGVDYNVSDTAALRLICGDTSPEALTALRQGKRHTMVRCMLWCRHGVDLRDNKRRRRAGAGAGGSGLAQEQQQQQDRRQQGLREQGVEDGEEKGAAGSGEEEGGQDGGAGGGGKGKACRAPRWKPCGCPHYLRLTVGFKSPNEVAVSWGWWMEHERAVTGWHGTFAPWRCHHRTEPVCPVALPAAAIAAVHVR